MLERALAAPMVSLTSVTKEIAELGIAFMAVVLSTFLEVAGSLPTEGGEPR